MKKFFGFAMSLVVAGFFVACGDSKGDSKTESSAGNAEKVYTIKFAHVVSSGSPKGKAADLFAKRAEELSGGRLKVEVFPSAQLVDDDKVFQELKRNNVQMAAPSFSKFTPIVKEFNLWDVPFIFRDNEHLHNVMDGEVGAILKEKIAQKGFIALDYWDSGFKQFSTNKNPIVLPSDAKGQKIRIMSSKVLEEQMKAIGANPQNINFGEVYSALQTGVVDVLQVEGHEFGPVAFGADESVFQHFGVSGADVLVVQCPQEFRVDKYACSRAECADFVFQAVEVDSRFPAHGRVHHGEQGGGDIDVAYASLEGGGGKAAKVGHHASSQVHQQGMAGGSSVSKHCPHSGEGFQVFVLIRRVDDDVRGTGHAGEFGHERPAFFLCDAVRQDEKFVMGTVADGSCKVFFQMPRDDDFLLLHVFEMMFMFCKVSFFWEILGRICLMDSLILHAVRRLMPLFLLKPVGRIKPECRCAVLFTCGLFTEIINEYR